MELVAEKTIRHTTAERRLIPADGHVVMGLSGGPDSMCLFHVLYNLRDELGFTMSAVHLNHRFRPGHAEEDQKFVGDLCDRLKVHCYSKTVDVNEAAAIRGETPEEAGRNERYIAFDEEAQRVEKNGISKDKIVIAVAQNRNDRIETVLMRILRGTGPDGLSGIPYRRKSQAGFDIVRPLLDTDRVDIEDYCESKALSPRIDHTNKETDYSRNRIRMDLIPRLKSEYNYSVEDALLRLSGLAVEDRAYFEGEVSKLLDSDCQFSSDNKREEVRAKINITSLTGLHPSIGRRAVITILKRLGLTQGIEAVHVDAAMDSINKNTTGKQVEFPSGYIMEISYGFAEFSRSRSMVELSDEEPSSIRIETDDIKDGKEIQLKDGTFVIHIGEFSKVQPHKNKIILNFSALKDSGRGLEIRYRRAGDRISIKGMEGTKKLQDLFVDEKIPRQQRDHIPVVVSGLDILWVVGIRKSDKFTNIDDSKDCMLLEWKSKN